ncbi:hypothetical protein ACWDUL_00210 [Nocardia niigatensis]|uniref:hypothetical protein n=1 Tax=Nocardia niigatensis TaxID=209249 RepID=UPI0002DB4CC0|nr:hypothetical protein [Nocardia niigatensis]
MLGTADEIGHDHGDIDARRVGRVVLAAVLMAVGVGAGIWLTSSGDRPIADTPIVNVPRLRHDRSAPVPHPPAVAPAQQVPPATAPTPKPAPTVVIPAPVAPHPVQIPAPVGPGAPPVGAAVNPPVPPDDWARPSD